MLSKIPELEFPDGCENMLGLGCEVDVVCFESADVLLGNILFAGLLPALPNRLDPPDAAG